MIPWEGHNITYIEFLPGMQNLNLIMREDGTTLNEEHSI